jgi:hypothetical protein
LAPYIACRAVGDSFAGYVREVGASLIAGVLLPAGVAVALWYALPDSWIRIVAVPLAGCTTSSMLTWLTLNANERARIQDGIRRIAQRASRLFRARSSTS